MNRFVALLRRPYFRALFVAHLASNLGDWLAFLALFGLAALEWRATTGALALLAIAWVTPLAFVSPLAGVLVDRWELRRVLVGCDVLRALLLLGMAATSRLEALAVLLFLHQSVSCFFNPAQASAVPRLVGRDEILMANALTTSAANISKLLGPLVAGGLVATLGTRGCFVADAVSFAVSGIWLATLPALPARDRDRTGSALGRTAADLGAGWQHLVRTRALATPLVFVLWAMAILGAFLAVFAGFARDRLQAGPTAMGLMLSTLGMGAVLGALAVGRNGDRFARLQCIGCGLAALAAGFGILALAGGTVSAIAGMALLGAGSAALLVPAHALVQEQTPPHLVGRVASTAVAAIGLAQAGAAALAASGVARLGFGRLLVGGGALLGLGAIAAFLVARSLGIEHAASQSDAAHTGAD